MLRVNDYEIRWNHKQFTDTSKKLDGYAKEPPEYRGLTTCEVTNPAVENIQFGGRSTCGVNDNFSYNEGRKKSLKRAMLHAGIPKEDRRAIWEAYRHMTTIPRW